MIMKRSYALVTKLETLSNHTITAKFKETFGNDINNITTIGDPYGLLHEWFPRWSKLGLIHLSHYETLLRLYPDDFEFIEQLAFKVTHNDHLLNQAKNSTTFQTVLGESAQRTLTSDHLISDNDSSSDGRDRFARLEVWLRILTPHFPEQSRRLFEMVFGCSQEHRLVEDGALDFLSYYLETIPYGSEKAKSLVVALTETIPSSSLKSRPTLEKILKKHALFITHNGGD